jgi:hypothetical protein
MKGGEYLDQLANCQLLKKIYAARSCVHLKYVQVFRKYIYLLRSWDSAVGIATGYRLDDRGVGVRVPVGSRIFSSRPDRLRGPPNLLSSG